MEIHSSIFTCFNPSRPKPWASVRFYFFFLMENYVAEWISLLFFRMLLASHLFKTNSQLKSK